jgi:predicted ATP-grasp superfamily ATP-dependent carboligase
LIGVTKQRTGAAFQAGEFQYAGSVGPITLASEAADVWQRIGNVLAAAFDLQGLFGVDAVVDDQGTIWPVEVNPRYTASVEILERGLGMPLLGWHVAACRDGQLSSEVIATREFHGKAIVYVVRDVFVSRSFFGRIDRANEISPWPAFADLPVPGSVVRRGEPLLTVFAQGDEPTAVEIALQQRIRTTLEFAR